MLSRILKSLAVLVCVGAIGAAVYFFWTTPRPSEMRLLICQSALDRLLQFDQARLGMGYADHSTYLYAVKNTDGERYYTRLIADSIDAQVAKYCR